jgi:hypothetical protein
MENIEKKPIFTEITEEEAASAGGGGPQEYLLYMLLAQTPASPGGVDFTNEEIHTGWNILINQAPPVNSFSSSRRRKRRSWFSWLFG